MSRSLIFDRDEHGQDPLSNTKLDRILALPSLRELEIDSATEANPQLIAYREYGSPEYYWVILYYNGIGYSFDLVAGMIIQLPSASAIRQIIAQDESSVAQRPRLIEI